MSLVEEWDFSLVARAWEIPLEDLEAEVARRDDGGNIDEIVNGALESLINESDA